MRRTGIAVCVLAFMAMVTGVAPVRAAGEKGAAEPKETPRLAEDDAEGARAAAATDPTRLARSLGLDYAAMVAELKLTDEQKAKIEEQIKAGAKAAGEWYRANRDKGKPLQEALRAAREANDREAMQKAAKDMAAFRAEQQAVAAPFRAAVMAVLTPQQKNIWIALTLKTSLLQRLNAVELTPEQTAAVAELCNQAAAANPALDTDDRAALRKAVNELYRSVSKDVLTPEQREQIMARRAGNRPANPDRERPQRERRANREPAAEE